MFELVLRVPEALVEPVSDLLADALDALAVSVEDADAGTAAEQALFGEPGLAPPAAGWQRSTLRALFADEGPAEAAAALLLARCGNDVHLQSLAVLPDADWVRLTQSQFAPVPITEHFWIVPSWHEPPPGARHVIRLDPGLAFGTGTHPTTRMCLRWIAQHADAQAPWPRVLDYGAGSGILAIAAALHGAGAIDAVDIDAAAVAASAENARRNAVTVRCAAPDAARGGYALVLANILATPLELLAPLLAAHVAPGGWLVLSGVLERQADRLRAAYAPHLAIDVLDAEEGWILMGGQRADARATA
ncbi:MAG: 50S ribosomal protein L11 methyltransferase [Proteobacteria bacterium]|nr:50S ribosomal protein L11 methyltransferase [Pseudomonadota bacterium]